MVSPVENIGFIGLGAMGFPMARRLLQGGKFNVSVLDIDRSRMDSMQSEGTTIAESPRAIAEKSDLVITMLPNSPEVETVMFGNEGVVAGLGKDNIVIDMSTIDPSVTRKVADEVHAKGAHMLDAPVGRTSFHAESGELLIMVGGEETLLTHCREVLEHFGKDIIHCGPVSSGGTMKLVNNILTTTIVAANAEALVLGAKAGLDTECMLKVLRSIAASNTHLASTYAVQALAGNIKPGFAVKLAEKDVGLALKMARDSDAPIHLADSTLALLREAREKGHADDDYTSLLFLLEEKAGVTIREKKSDGMK